MNYSGNKKASILYVLEILRDYSDENHLLLQSDIVNKLYSLYGMECERKSVGASIDTLIDCGFDIVKTRSGCFLASREFEPSEIQFLIDAVFSSRSIDSKHARALAGKLSEFLSTYKRKQYKYVYKSEEINRSNNKELFYNIDVINEAIENNKQIKFSYNKFYYKKSGEEKKPYVVNPYFLINTQGKYFLVCNYDCYDGISNYKVDRIHGIEMLDKPIKPVTKLAGFEKGFDVAKYANENVYMFTNETVNAVVKIYDNNATTYVDEWFGKNAKFFEKDGEVFAEIKANEESLVYWCLQYGESIELLSPTSCRNKIKKLLDTMTKRYK